MEKETSLKAVILDFDGTIGDTRGLIVRTMQQTLAEVGLPQRSDDECAAMIGLPLKQTFTQLMPMDDATGDLCEATYRRIFAVNNRPGTVRPFPGVCETIRSMHRAGLLVTIASSRFRTSLMEFLEKMRLVEYVPYVLGAGDVEHAKPAPDMVLKTLADNSLKPCDAIVVGDTEFDIRMAHAAGVRAVGVTYGNGRREDLEREHAEWIIDSFGELDGIM